MVLKASHRHMKRTGEVPETDGKPIDDIIVVGADRANRCEEAVQAFRLSTLSYLRLLGDSSEANGPQKA